MRSSRQLGIVAALLLQLLPARADDVITNIISPIASYQYPNDFSSEALTNGGIQSSLVSFQYLQNFSNAALTSGGIMSPLVSYQYFEWPGDDVLRLQSSPLASYYYQYLNAPSLIVVQTDRVPKTAETTPVTSFPYPSQSQLETFMGGVFTTDPPFPP